MKYVKCMLAVMLFSIVSYNVGYKEIVTTIPSLVLANVESIAGCETSSNHGNNTGYCSGLVGGSGDSCVSTGSGSEPRCSGNY